MQIFSACTYSVPEIAQNAMTGYNYSNSFLSGQQNDHVTEPRDQSQLGRYQSMLPVVFLASEALLINR